MTPTVPTLAVLLDNGTGSFPIDITTKVLSAEEYGGYSISRGRDDWQGAVTAGELSLTLNNSDGRFTPGSTILGTPSPITVDQRIRLKETVNGVTLTRFTGYVKSWPVSWPATVPTFSTVNLAATDAQARTERRTLRSMLEEEILLDGPTAYYTLGEAAGSLTAGDTSGNQAPLLVMTGSGAPVVFGDGIGPVDGLSAATFAGGETLVPASLITGTIKSFGCWFNCPSNPGAIMPLVGTDLAGLTVVFSQLVADTGNGTSGPGSVLGPNVDDGLTHFALVTLDGTNIRLYLDSVLIGSAAATAVPSFINGVGAGGHAVWHSPDPFTGTMSHVATYSTALSSTRVAQQYAVGTAVAETADLRVTRLASYASVTTGTIDTSTTIVPIQDTSDNSAQDALQEVADTEMGLVYVDGSGLLTFHNRSRGTVKTTPDLILDSQYVTPDVEPVTDDQNIVNYVEATTAGTGATQIAQNATSEDTHGRYPESNTYLVTTDAEALDRASWIVSKQAEPTLRYGTLTINLYKMTAATAAVVVAALDLGCWLRVTSLASQNPGGTIADVVVQGWNSQTTGESWSITCNVTARSLETAFILDSSLLDGVDPLAV